MLYLDGPPVAIVEIGPNPSLGGAQVAGAVGHLKEQAQKMGASFVGGDYATFVGYTYPTIVRLVGGSAKMVDLLDKSMANMKVQGTTFTKISFDEPSRIVVSGKEVQATIAQHTEIKLTPGRLLNTSTLIAISADNGLHWTFIDTSNKDLAALRKALPNLSAALVVPPQAPPVHYDN